MVHEQVTRAGHAEKNCDPEDNSIQWESPQMPHILRHTDWLEKTVEDVGPTSRLRLHMLHQAKMLDGSKRISILADRWLHIGRSSS